MREMKTIRFPGDTEPRVIFDQFSVHYDKQELTDEQKSQALENIGVTFFGVPYSSAKEVIDLSTSVKMYLFATADGYDAVVDGEGAIPDNTVDFVTNVEGLELYPYDLETINRPFDGEKIHRLHIGEGITSIGNYFMYRAYNLQHLSFANIEGITHLGTCSFAYTQIEGTFAFTGLTDTKLSRPFMACPKLLGVTFSPVITEIEKNSFKFCTELQYVKGIGTVTNIGDMAFEWCCSLESIDVVPNLVTLGAYVFTLTPSTARLEGTEIRLSEAAGWTYNTQSVMDNSDKKCFTQNNWSTEQLAEIRAIKGNKTICLKIPESDNQGSDFNKQYGVFPYKVNESTGKINPSAGKFMPRRATAAGLCGIFSLFHIYNIMNPNKQYDSFYEFMERGIVPNKIEVTQDIYNALELLKDSDNGFDFLPDMRELMGDDYYSVGSKISAADLPLSLITGSSTFGDVGTSYWGMCKALGWTATEFLFNSSETTTGAEGKQLIIDSLTSGKPVMMEIYCAGGTGGKTTGGAGAHAVVALGYDASTDKFLIIDSTGSFPSDIVPLLYWGDFETLITPESASAIWTFDFGEEITMTHIDDKLNTLLGTVNSGFHSVNGSVTVTTQTSPDENSPFVVDCPAGAKLFVFEADEATFEIIKQRTEASATFTIGVYCNFANTITGNEKHGCNVVWATKTKAIVYGGIVSDNTDGVGFVCQPLVAGTYNWTAYYWND